MRWFRALVALAFVVALVGGVTYIRNAYRDPSEVLWPEASAVNTSYSVINGRTEFVRKVVFPDQKVAQVDERLKPLLSSEEGWKRVAMKGGDVSYTNASGGHVRVIEVRRYRGAGPTATTLIEYGALQPWQAMWLTATKGGTNPAEKAGGYSESLVPSTRKLTTSAEK